MNISAYIKILYSKVFATFVFKFYILLLCIIFSSRCFSQNIAYNKVYQLACHNCYEPLYGNIVDVFQYTKAIEIDIWDNFQGTGIIHAGNKMNQDWYVKHDIVQKGNINCCGGSFRDCLNRIKDWDNKNPMHDVITIFLDKKENWSDNFETRKPNDLDELILSIIGDEKIFSPSRLLNGRVNLKDAALYNNWPSLDSLKGKFIFVITNGTEITSRNPLNEYLLSQKNNSVCFVAPEISNENEIQMPIGFTPENIANCVFFNLQYSNRKLATKIFTINCLTRVFGSPETIDVYNELITENINFIALDNLRLVK